MAGRALPKQWGKYFTARIAHAPMNDANITDIHDDIVLSARFIDSRSETYFEGFAVCKAGLNCLPNRLNLVSKSLSPDWPFLKNTNFE